MLFRSILPTNDGEDGLPEEIGGDISTDAPSREAPEERTVPSEPSPPNEETDAAPESEGREADHAAHLRRATHTRRAAVESSSPEQVPQRRMRLAVLCTVAILVLGFIRAWTDCCIQRMEVYFISALEH